MADETTPTPETKNPDIVIEGEPTQADAPSFVACPKGTKLETRTVVKNGKRFAVPTRVIVPESNEAPVDARDAFVRGILDDRAKQEADANAIATAIANRPRRPSRGR